MATRIVTDTIRYLVDPWEDQDVAFTLLSPIATDEGVYMTCVITATTDASGVFSATLPVPDDVAAAAPYQCRLPNGVIFPFTLSAGVGSVTLGALLVQATGTGTANSLQVLIDTHAAIKASAGALGHVRIDGSTITIDGNGVISVNGVPWADVTSTPTTLAGYGISDAATQAQLDAVNTRYTSLRPLAAADGGKPVTLPRVIAGDSITLVAGDVAVVYLRNVAAATITGFTTFCRAAGADITARIGLYRVGGDGTLTCVARTAQDTALWEGNATAYTSAIADNGAASPSPISSVALVADADYAVALLAMSASVNPQIAGRWLINDAFAGIAPRLSASIYAQADLAATYGTGSIFDLSTVAWARLEPA